MTGSSPINGIGDELISGVSIVSALLFCFSGTASEFHSRDLHEHKEALRGIRTHCKNINARIEEGSMPMTPRRLCRDLT